MTDTQAMATLEPCPFCGGDAHWSPTYIDADEPGTVTCANGCGATVICSGPKAVRIAAWNCRATPAPPPAGDAELRKALSKVMPIRVNDGPDYAEVYFADGATHSTQAMTMNPQDWLDLQAAYAATPPSVPAQQGELREAELRGEQRAIARLMQWLGARPAPSPLEGEWASSTYRVNVIVAMKRGENWAIDAACDFITALSTEAGSGEAREKQEATYNDQALADRCIDFLEERAEEWMADSGVQRMFNAIASVFEKYAPQEIMDRFREKLGIIGRQCHVEGALRVWEEISAQQRARGTPLPDIDDALSQHGEGGE